MAITVLEERILRAIAGGATTISAVRTATHAHPWPKTKVVLDELIERGFVKRGRGTLVSLTAEGRVPITPAVAPPMKLYVPPPPAYRRAGAEDWKRFPSLSTAPREEPAPEGSRDRDRAQQS